MTKLGVLVAILVGAVPGRARAEHAPHGADATLEQTLEKVVSRTVSRARRAIALGPTVGVSSAISLSPADLDAPISFGLAAVLFDVPVVPTPERVRAIVKERVEAAAKARLAEVLRHGRPPLSRGDLEQLAREVYEDVKAEVLAELRPRLIEPPRLAVALEGLYRPRAGSFGARATAGYGFGPITVGPTLQIGDGAHLGGEIALRLVPGKGPRASVFDLFVRGDFAISDSATNQVGIGMRAVLDLI